MKAPNAPTSSVLGDFGVQGWGMGVPEGRPSHKHLNWIYRQVYKFLNVKISIGLGPNQFARLNNSITAL